MKVAYDDCYHIVEVHQPSSRRRSGEYDDTLLCHRYRLLGILVPCRCRFRKIPTAIVKNRYVGTRQTSGLLMRETSVGAMLETVGWYTVDRNWGVLSNTTPLVGVGLITKLTTDCSIRARSVPIYLMSAFYLGRSGRCFVASVAMQHCNACNGMFPNWVIT